MELIRVIVGSFRVALSFGCFDGGIGDLEL